MSIAVVKSIEDLQSLYHELVAEVVNAAPRESLIFSHFGDFNQAKIDSILQVVESSIIDTGDKRQVMKRICSVLIEMLQNISIHSAKLKGGHMHAYVIVSRSADHYRLFTGNLVLGSDIQRLQGKLDHISTLDQSEVRKMFIETLCNDEFDVKGGAGLGLLTIAKRSEGQFNYNITRVNDQLGYYQLEISIPHQGF